ncbi:hypothetical protein CQW23_18906 [Capsicum baccatum]|uniref:Uncharacterized protein n=1 Tax=Capsicum baccatum TaxID=33114 RepID=A0A2G2W499_CAPBA|nr:hypothetical protein CQW23_35309 [Capsicum baccatum]PHT40052.1 hypothetical protein CQW23_18906 [Capsicum baccatum]
MLKGALAKLVKLKSCDQEVGHRLKSRKQLLLIEMQAADQGRPEVVRVLLESVVEDHDIKEKLVRMTDYSGDTALHKTLRSRHLDIVKLLVKEDPEFECPTNHAQETPLYLAAESGFIDILREILDISACSCS